MLLDVMERFALLALLPQQGDFTTLKIVRETREELSFTEEENAILDFQSHDDGRVTWNADADPHREFRFGQKAARIIQDALEKADKQSKLTLQQLPLYEKFMESEQRLEVVN